MKKKKQPVKPTQKAQPFLMLFAGWHTGRGALTIIRRWPKIMLGLGGVYLAATAVLAGVATQGGYNALKSSLGQPTGTFTNTLQRLKDLYIQTAAGGVGDPSTYGDASARVWSIVLLLLFWLIILWAARQLQNKKYITIRQALYNGSTAVIPLAVVVFLLLLQLLPAVFGIYIFSVGSATSVATGVFGTVVLELIGALFVLLSVYWVAHSVVALSVVSEPGTYPLQAMKTAKALVNTHRLTVCLRVAWLGIWLVLVSAAVLFPLLILDSLLPLGNVPLIPVAAQLLYGFYLVFTALYVYTLHQELSRE